MAKKIESKPSNMKSTLRSILATAAEFITLAYLGSISFARNVNLKGPPVRFVQIRPLSLDF